MSYIEEREDKAYIAPMWGLVMGNNHTWLNTPSKRYGGPFSPLKYAGKKLSKELWEDLLYRLNICRIRVYKPNQEEWTDSPVGSSAYIRLDEEENIKEIDLWL